MPPFWQLNAPQLISVWQYIPVKPDLHKQTALPEVTTQVAPFRHGLLEHAFTESKIILILEYLIISKNYLLLLLNWQLAPLKPAI